ncbi:MAG: terminase [Acidobacteria bacterium]|nr:terminase [Acidobacteriota bacterium]
MYDEEPVFRLQELNSENLLTLGKKLDDRPGSLQGSSILMALAEKLLRVRTKSGSTEPLQPNRVQQAFECTRGQRNIVLKARQLGLTTWAAARFFLKTITQRGTLTLQVAHTLDSAEEIFRIVHRFVDNLPEQLRGGFLKTSHANSRQICFPKLDSEYRVVSAGERNAGRGLTVQNLHCSELARWPGDPAETLAGLRAALSPTGEQILESTPNGVGGCFYDEWHSAAESGTVKHFYPWWLEEQYRLEAVEPDSLSEEERALTTAHGLTLEQIGYRRQVRANFRGLACQEFAEDEETCFRASGDSVFELESVENRLEVVPRPAETRRNGELEIWLPPLPGKHYVIGVDPAGGGSEGDYTAAEVIEAESGLQCAEFASHMGGLETARFLNELGREYNDAWLAVERNNHGHGVLWLLESVFHYPHIYQQNNQLGWITNSTTRPTSIGRLNAALVDHPSLFMSRRLLTECRSFVRLPDGTTGAQPGAHDDLVMAMGIGLAVRDEILEKKRIG